MNTLSNELLDLQNAGWRSLCDGTGGEFYGRMMTDEARMVLANGMTMTRPQVVESLAQAPPWDGYSIEDPVVVRISENVAALVYAGTGHREDGDRFTAIMVTTYLRDDEGWRLALYQQTPTA